MAEYERDREWQDSVSSQAAMTIPAIQTIMSIDLAILFLAINVQLWATKDTNSTTTTYPTIVETSSTVILRVFINPRLANTTVTTAPSSTKIESHGPSNSPSTATNTEQPVLTYRS
ncbi:hypothetical protein DL98DRAFT_9063 [Cadophora sp. DSE1049]|nr:hypothetical protein DL98DRAFT_9063 [Cadophora sp. DSE1049]